MNKTTVVVTGASSGIGEAICRKLISNGYSVVGVARNQHKLDALAKDLSDKFFALNLDVNDTRSSE